MSPTKTLFGLATAILLGGPAIGQSYAVSPAGLQFQPGNTPSTFPFQGVSASYQQIHHSVDMAALHGRRAMVMTGMHFRAYSTMSLPARTWELQLSIGATTREPSSMSILFAQNFSTPPTVVLPYKKVSVPAARGTGPVNPAAWRIPFQIYIYDPVFGNFCWEWRHRNAGTFTRSPIDAVNSVYTNGPTVLPNFGTGCRVAGRVQPATAVFDIASGSVTARLRHATSNAPAAMFLGLQRADLDLGWCTKLLFPPLATIRGTTDGAGSWLAGRAPASTLDTKPYAEVYAQFAFADASQPAGLGLSDLGTVATPANGGRYVSRLYRVGSKNGDETAVAGFLSRNYSLVTMFVVQ